MPKHRFHRDRKVRLHASGKWVCTIGRRYSPRSGKFVDADHYFTGSEAEAIPRANALARQWELLCINWDQTERSYLTAMEEPFPEIPRWPSGAARKGRAALTVEQVAGVRAEGHVEHDELGRAFAEFAFAELVPNYRYDRDHDLREGDTQNSALSKLIRQMHLASNFLPSDIPAVQLTEKHFRHAKTEMLAKLGRRTTKNYLSAAMVLLRWLYGRYGGNEGAVPIGIEDAVRVSLKSTNTSKIVIPGIEQIEEAIEKTKGTISQLDMMLGLNCGMYPSDIGRLLLTELDSDLKGVFWDREKEPSNHFRIYHVFWPETLALVRKYINDGSIPKKFFDHRGKQPNPVDAATFAFLDKGRPRYLIKPKGSANDLVGKRWQEIGTGIQFHCLRKATEDLLCNLIEDEGDGDHGHKVEVLGKRFLGQKDDELVLLYRRIGRGAYRQMNTYLAKLGDALRGKGVFRHIEGCRTETASRRTPNADAHHGAAVVMPLDGSVI